MAELKPCPFCGGEAFVFKITENPLPMMCAVVCKACHAGTNHKTTEARAVEAWNRRSNDDGE